MAVPKRMSYSNVEDSAHEDDGDIVSESKWRHYHVAAASGILLLCLGGSLALVGHAPLLQRPLRGPKNEEVRVLLRGPGDEEVRELARITSTTQCSELWGQCGGEGYTGPTCCEEGSECQHWKLDSYPSYHQCRKPAPPACADPEPGSQCFNMIQSAKGAAWSNPGPFHGLTGESSEKEFQMFFHWTQKDESQCPEPCGPGTCYFVLHVEGCDTLDTWYCQHDDGTLKFACCCNYFHEEKSLDKPENPDPDMANAIAAVGSNTPSLFCTAMCQAHGYELGLLRVQYAKGRLGLFDCNEWAVYSNVSLTLSPEGEKPIMKTGLINGSLSASVGGNWGTALNTDVFIKFWDRVLEDPKAWKCDWVVKVDPDTMWLPVRLRALLRTTHGPLGQPEPEKGLYLNNCHVGLHGPIEVLSHRALRTYKGEKEDCRHGKVSKIGQEDYFLRKCFDKIGILKVDAYNLMLEATLACQEVASALNPDRPPCFSPQVAFHPFKTADTWMRCHTEAVNHPWALPAVPVTDGPSEANDRHG